jgi:hypothetical protein
MGSCSARRKVWLRGHILLFHALCGIARCVVRALPLLFGQAADVPAKGSSEKRRTRNTMPWGTAGYRLLPAGESVPGQAPVWQSDGKPSHSMVAPRRSEFRALRRHPCACGCDPARALTANFKVYHRRQRASPGKSVQTCYSNPSATSVLLHFLIRPKVGPRRCPKWYKISVPFTGVGANPVATPGTHRFELRGRANYTP